MLTGVTDQSDNTALLTAVLPNHFYCSFGDGQHSRKNRTGGKYCGGPNDFTERNKFACG